MNFIPDNQWKVGVANKRIAPLIPLYALSCSLKEARGAGRVARKS